MTKGENDLNKIWLMKKIQKYIFGILGTRCFSSMLPSMPNVEILNMGYVNMNADAMGEYVGIVELWFWLCLSLMTT